MDYEKIIEKFHTMYGNFPARARLIKKDRTVLAVNKISSDEGFTVGVRCIDTSTKEAHAGCLANLALKEQSGKYKLSADKKRMPFWVPIDNFDDVFVHFSVPMPEV